VNVSYADLADKLAVLGVKENDRNIANKIARGSFTAVFFVQCLEAIGCQTVHLNGSALMGRSRSTITSTSPPFLGCITLCGARRVKKLKRPRRR
jgi:hypothetical protein